MVPKQILDTLSSELPSFVYSMMKPYIGETAHIEPAYYIKHAIFLSPTLENA